MPPPRLLGPSQEVPGGVDVETDFGVLTLDPNDPQVAGLGGAGAGPAMAYNPGGSNPGGVADALGLGGFRAPPQQMSDAPPADPLAMFRPGGQSPAPNQFSSTTGERFRTGAPMQPAVPTPQELDAMGVGRTVDPNIQAQRNEQTARDAQRLGRTRFNDAPSAGPAPSNESLQTPPMSPADAYLQSVLTPQRGGGGGPLRTRTSTLTQTLPGNATPEQRAALETATTQGREAREDLTDIAFARADAARAQHSRTAEAIRSTQANLATDRAEYENQRAQMRQRIQDQRVRIDERREEVSEMGLDPDRIWHEKGTGAQIVAAIAQALGAFGQGLTGGPNVAADIINSAISRDLEAQRYAIEQAKGDVEGQEGLLAQLYAELGDMDAAQAAARELAWADVERENAAIASEVGADLAIEDAEEFAAVARQQQAAAAEAGIRSQIGTTTVTTETRERRGGGGGARRPAGMSADQMRMYQLLGGTMPGQRPTLSADEARYIDRYGEPGGEGRASAPAVGGLRVRDAERVRQLGGDERRQVSDIAAGVNTVRAGLDELRAIREEYGTEFWDTNARARAAAARASVARGLGVMEGAGAFGDQERAGYMERVPNATGYDPRQMVPGIEDPIMSNIDALIADVERSGNARTRPYGYELDSGSGEDETAPASEERIRR